MNEQLTGYDTIEQTMEEQLMGFISMIDSKSTASDLMEVVNYYSECIRKFKAFDITENPELNKWLRDTFSSATLAQRSIKDAFANGSLELYSRPRDIPTRIFLNQGSIKDALTNVNLELGLEPITITLGSTARQVHYYQEILLDLRQELATYNYYCSQIPEGCSIDLPVLSSAECDSTDTPCNQIVCEVEKRYNTTCVEPYELAA